MSTGLSVVMCGCLTLAALPAAAQTAGLLTPAQAVREALARNARMLNQQDSVRQAELGVRLARSAFRPKIVPNVFGSFGQTDVNSQDYRLDVTQTFVTGTQLRVGVGTSTSQIPLGPGDPDRDIHFYNADTTLTLSQPLLRGFGPAIARRPLTSAELRRADADREQVLAEQQVAIETVSAYYRVVAQQTFVEVAKRSLDRARRLREASEAKLDAGIVSQLDVLRAQQLVFQAETQLFDAQSAVEDARDQLSFILGRETSERFEVESVIPRPPDNLSDLENAEAVAIANRLDLKTLVARAEDADRQLSFARNQLLPQVDVNLAVTRRETASSFGDSFGLDGFRFATFFTIAMPIDRTAQLVEYQNAVIDRDRRAREADTLRRRIADEAKRATRERNRLLRAFLAAEASVDIGRREAEVARVRYDRGLSNNLDVIAAESNLLGAESRRIQALADLATARLSLRAVLGILDPRNDVASPAPVAASSHPVP
jgi:outer membrane protein TolC